MKHHAYVLVCRAEESAALEQALFASLEGEESIVREVTRHSFASLGVDDARAIKEAAYRTASMPGAQSWHIVSCTSATVEAQNALLKVLEEPPKDTFFVLCVPHAEVLLPTVRSRLMTVSGRLDTEKDAGVKGEENARVFIEMSLPERVRHVAILLKEVESKGDGALHAFLDDLERYYAKALRATRASDISSSVLPIVFATREYLYGRSPSRKLLFENIALQLPHKR